VKRCFVVALSLLLLTSVAVRAQETEQPADPANSLDAPALQRVPNTSGFEILNKATPMQVKNYPFRVLAGVRNHWFPQLRALRQSPDWKRGTTVIEFAINRDGSLSDLRTVESAGSGALDGAASQAIASAAPFPPLPETYPGNSLRLRYRFGYDQPADSESPMCNGPNWGAHSETVLLKQTGDGIVPAGVTPPHPTSSRDPEYSDTARRMKYQSRVRLAGTVDPEGAFTDLCVLIPAGAGLDGQAMSAVKTWRFEPATLNGQPTAVRINVEVDFRLY
jgi:TonB family protein